MGYYTTFIESAWRNVQFEELSAPDQSPQEKYTEDGFEATMYFKVPWAQRHFFCQALKGGPVAGGTVFLIPARYNPFPTAICVSCEMVGMGAPSTEANGSLKYEAAKVTAVFSTKAFESQQQQQGEVMISESIEGAAEFLTLPAAGLYWDNAQTDPLTDSDSPGKIYKTIAWNYTIHKINQIPANIWNVVGCVNQDALYSPTFKRTFAAETLLFSPPSLKREITATEVRAWELSCHLTIKETGWNKLLKPGATTPQIIYDSAGVQYRIYEKKDFGNLLPKST